jgi:hypothetical protein
MLQDRLDASEKERTMEENRVKEIEKQTEGKFPLRKG